MKNTSKKIKVKGSNYYFEAYQDGATLCKIRLMKQELFNGKPCGDPILRGDAFVVLIDFDEDEPEDVTYRMLRITSYTLGSHAEVHALMHRVWDNVPFKWVDRMFKAYTYNPTK